MLQPDPPAPQGSAVPGPVVAPALRPLSDFQGSLARRVHASLREAILALAYPPGAILRKGEICAAFGVSRSPVSEALARLAAEGLVDVVPQAGTYVARFSMAEIREGAFLREALELAAVERVAETATPDQIDALRRNLRMQEVHVAAGDAAGFHGLDMAMHELILSFTGYRRLSALAQTTWLHVDRARRLILPEPGRIAATLEEHRAILDALAARDPAAARAATRHHLRQLLTVIEPLATTRPDLFA
jgi:DNA-binding GntR family transcriptional regulator